MSSKTDEQILRAAKEIVVKFIEVGRISPTSFGESFTDIYKTIDATVKDSIEPTKEKKDSFRFYKPVSELLPSFSRN